MKQRKNKLGNAGFILMLAGPATLILVDVFHSNFGDFSEFVGNAIMWICLALPAIGVVLCIICLLFWKEANAWGRGLSIVTVIMCCNPVFFLFYYLSCGIASKTLAGLPWM